MIPPMRSLLLVPLLLTSGCSTIAGAFVGDDEEEGTTQGGDTSSGDVAVRRITVGAAVNGDTRQAGDDHQPTCGDAAGSGDDLWTFVAPANGFYQVHVTAEYDSVLAIRGPDQAWLDCNDDAGSKRASELIVELLGGQAYGIVVDGYRGERGPYRLIVEGQAEAPVPPNRHGVLTLDHPVSDQTTGAGDHHTPACGARQGSSDHVWHFRALRDGSYRFRVTAEYDSVLAVIDESNRELECNDDFGGSTRRSEVVVALSTGHSYGVVVDGYQGAEGPYQLAVEDVAVGVPQNRAGGGAITVGQAVTGDTTGAGDQRAPSCGSSPGNPDHVWRFTAPQSATYRVNLTGGYDCLVALFDDTGAELACNDDEGSTSQSQVIVGLTAGRTYDIAVDGFSNGQGTYRLTVDAVAAGPAPPPAVPQPAGTLPVRGSVQDTTVGGADQYTPSCGAMPGSSDDVWQFTTTRAGWYRFHVAAQYDSVLAIFDDTGAEVDCNDDHNTTAESLIVTQLLARHTYHVVVDGYRGQTGAYTLTARRGRKR